MKLKLNLGNEDLGMLDPSDFYYNLDNGIEGLVNLIEKVNYNEKYPQNHNILITNQSDSYCHVYHEDQWRQMQRKDLCVRLLIRHYKWLDAFTKVYKDFTKSKQLSQYGQMRSEIKPENKNLKRIIGTSIVEMAVKHKKMIQESAKEGRKKTLDIKSIAKEMIIDLPTPVF
jgi:hypothetical protein